MRFVKRGRPKGKKEKKCYLTCLKLRERQDKVMNPGVIRFSLNKGDTIDQKLLFLKNMNIIYPQRESSSRWCVH